MQPTSAISPFSQAGNPESRGLLPGNLAREKSGATCVLGVEDFPEALAGAVKTARDYLGRGMQDLLVEEHRGLMLPAMEFLEKRIGAHHYMTTFCGPAE